MNVHFDLITEVPSDKELEAVHARVRSREERRRKGAQLRRQQMLEQAMALYLEAGDSGFRMRDLAERCGYTAGALYMYFKDRDALLDALREQLLHALSDDMLKAAGKLMPRRGQPWTPELAMTGLVHLGQVWWRSLATDHNRRQLLLRSSAGGGAFGPESPAGPVAPDSSQVLESLLVAIEPAVAMLMRLGVSKEKSLALHADWVTWAVGQCVLAGSVIPEVRLMAMEQHFLQRMEGDAMTSAKTDGREASSSADVAQSDLFS